MIRRRAGTLLQAGVLRRQAGEVDGDARAHENRNDHHRESQGRGPVAIVREPANAHLEALKKHENAPTRYGTVIQWSRRVLR